VGDEAAPILEPGLRAQATLDVTHADTATALRSGDVPVLATPRVLALAEEAAVLAVAGRLPAGSTSVGAWVELFHLAPTRVGRRVVAEAVLESAEGRRLEFSIRVREGGEEVARARHRRVIVPRARFGA
jgi:predicted thioesterase